MKEKKTKTQHNTICVGHHHTQANTNNANKTCSILQTTRGKDELNIDSCGNVNELKFKVKFHAIFRNLQSKDFSIWLKYLKIILWNYSNHLILKLVAMSLDGPVSIFYFNWKFKMATTKGQSLAHDLMGEWIKKEFFDEQEN
jgi:hypothetical protein